MKTTVAKYDRTPFVRGDTLLGWSVQISVDGEPAQLLSARLQLRTGNGGLVYDWPAVVSGNLVSLPDVAAEVTAGWPVGRLEYDLEVTLAGGRTVTWLCGAQPVIPDRTR